MTPGAVLWIDASAGVAGDMLLGALVDAGADVDHLQACVDAVIPGSVRLSARPVTRAGLRATKVEVEVLVEDPPHRSWSAIRELLAAADLPEGVRSRALAAFARLAEAEGRVHGIPPVSVHFHEVGALDAIADVVGTCAGIDALGVLDVVVSPVALGSGTITAHHGVLPVPAPAVLELSRGWEVLAGGQGELATPTGMALVTSLAAASGPMPAARVVTVGVGAGTRDPQGRANVVRLVLGSRAATGTLGHHDAHADGLRAAVVLEANVDDLDPRLWPVVLDRLLAAGAWDAWLTPIVMKKGRPAHTLHALGSPAQADALGAVMLEQTTTLGVRRVPVSRDSLARDWVEVDLASTGPRGATGPGDNGSGREAPGGHRPLGRVRIKVGHRAGRVVQAMPEFEDVAAAAAAGELPTADVLTLAHAAAVSAGLVPGSPWPVTRTG